MADIGKKETTAREAVAEGRVILKRTVLLAIKKNHLPKGDVLAAAEIAGIMAAKKTSSLIPLCHPIPVEYVCIEFFLGKKEIKIKATVRSRAKTGAEMEALAATSVSALTIYDMCKPLDKDIVISDIRLIRKSGGKSGVYERA